MIDGAEAVEISRARELWAVADAPRLVIGGAGFWHAAPLHQSPAP